MLTFPKTAEAPINVSDKILRVMLTQNLGLMKMNYVAVLFDSHQ